MWRIRSKLTVLVRRTMPTTWYPLSRRNSARYAPSWPVMPVISAVDILPLLKVGWPDFCGHLSISSVLVVDSPVLSWTHRHFTFRDSQLGWTGVRHPEPPAYSLAPGSGRSVTAASRLAIAGA